MIVVGGRREQTACARIAERAKELFMKAKEAVLPDGLFSGTFGMTPAFAGTGALPGCSIHSPDKLSNAVFFDTGKAPQKGSPSRRLMEWQDSIEVLMPNEARDPKKLQMAYPEAQKAVSKITKEPKAVHQYIAYEAARLCGTDPLVQKHTWHMVVGAWAEDFFFAPGESMKDVCLDDPSKVPGVIGKMAKQYGGYKPGPVHKAFMFLSNLWKKFTGDVEADPLNRPYFAHFYDRTRAPGDQGINLLDGELRFQSSRARMQKYWDLACDYYAKGDTPRAFLSLGHLIHLVGDLHVPAHVHNDPHGPSPLLGKEDSFEKWTARADYPAITRSDDQSNTSIWCSKTIAPPKADGSWNKGNIVEKLGGFAATVSYNTQKFRSVDAKGAGLLPYQDKLGALNDAECFYQGEKLIPAAILDSAKLIANFTDYVKREGKPVA